MNSAIRFNAGVAAYIEPNGNGVSYGYMAVAVATACIGHNQSVYIVIKKLYILAGTLRMLREMARAVARREQPNSVTCWECPHRP